MYLVFMEMWWGLLISDNMKVTVTPTGNLEDLDWVAAGAVRMENMVMKHVCYISSVEQSGVIILQIYFLK